jgi:hypothetical protein
VTNTTTKPQTNLGLRCWGLIGGMGGVVKPDKKTEGCGAK